MEDDDFEVGGRYKLNSTVKVWSNMALSGATIAALHPKDVVLLVHMEGQEGARVGNVIHNASNTVGWVDMEEPKDKKGKGPFIKRKLEGSWDLRGRYEVKHPATVRHGSEIGSEKVCDLSRGDEVLILDFAVDTSPDANGKMVTRLRALVNAVQSGDVGWLSPETANGEHLLHPVNLHSHKVVDVHGSTKKTGSKPVIEADQPLPWEVNGKYRLLEKTELREGPELTTAELKKLAAGSVLLVKDLHKVLCGKIGGDCPCALVTVEGGPDNGAEGWVRCLAKDGHKLVDTRDLLEVDKVLNKMKSTVGGSDTDAPKDVQAKIVARLRSGTTLSVQEPEGFEAHVESPVAGRAAEDLVLKAEEVKLEEEEKKEQQKATSIKVTPPSYPGKFESFKDSTKEDRIISEPRETIDSSSQQCFCSCGR